MNKDYLKILLILILFSSFVNSINYGQNQSENEQILTSPSDELISNQAYIKNNQILIENSGYIIEFEQEPVLKKQSQLEQQIETIKQQILKQTNNYTKQLLTNQLLQLESNIKKTLEQYNIQIKINNEEIKDQIKQKLINTLETQSNAITQQGQLQILNEYTIVFNGIALDITREEAKEIEQIDGVKKVWPNMQVKALLQESVPQIQEGIIAGQLDQQGNDCVVSGQECLTGEGIKIAIVDTGVDYTHNAFGSCSTQDFLEKNCEKIIGGYDFVNEDNDPMDDQGHGTHVTGIAAGNGILKGVAPKAQILSYKVLNEFGSGTWDQIIAGIEQAVYDKADIISLSLGGEGNPDDPMSQAVDNAVNSGVVVVVAAGNEGSEQTIGSPGAARKAITVGAIDKSNNLAYFSSKGPEIWNSDGIEKAIIKPDLVAPGVNICAAQWENAFINNGASQCFDNEHVSISGTSMATPHVAGAIALLKQKNPNWTPEEIKASIKATSNELYNYSIFEQGNGKINVRELIKLNEPAILTEINNNQYKINGVIDIVGTVKGNNLQKFELYYKNFNEINWTLICSKQTEVDNNILCENFDSTNINQGKLILKLKVYDKNNSFFNEYSMIKLNNFIINSVGTTNNYVNGIADIYGEINIDYNSFKIEILNLNSGSPNWETICFVESNLVGNKLCSFDFSNIQNGKQKIRLSVLRNNIWSNSEIFEIAIIKELMNNWPVKEPCHSGNSIIKPEYFDNKTRIFSITSLECYSGGSNGSKINFYDYTTKENSIYDLYKNNNPAGNTNYMSGTPVSIDNEKIGLSSIYQKSGFIDIQGNLLDEWPFERNGDAIGPFIISNEHVFQVINEWHNNSQLTLYGFNKNGIILDNFPIPIEFDKNFKNWTISSVGGSLIKDINGEDYIGVLIAFFDDSREKSKLFFDIYSASEGIRKSRTLLYDGSNGWIDYRGLTFASADFTNNGKSEIAIGYMVFDLNEYYKDQYNMEVYKSYLKVLDIDGNIISEPYSIKGYTINQLRITNFDYENPIILLHLQDTWPTTYNGQKVIGVNLQGEILTEINISDPNKYIEGFTIGDVTGDNKQNIVLAYRPRWWQGMSSGILIYNQNGVLEKEIEIPTFGEAEQLEWGADPILTDFSGNGKVDIILKTLHLQKNFLGSWQSNIFVFETNADYNEENMDWPMFQKDPQNTGCYNCGLVFSQTKKSRILNNSNNSLNGQLSIFIEKKIDDQWIIQTDHTKTYKDIIIPNKGFLEIGNGKNNFGEQLFEGWNNTKTTINEKGQYRINIDFTSTNNTKIVEKKEFEIIPNCSSSDGGINIYEKGTTAGLESVYDEKTDQWIDEKLTITDRCLSEEDKDPSFQWGKLAEYSCVESTGYVVSDIYDCPNGCSNGSCNCFSSTECPNEGEITCKEGIISYWTCNDNSKCQENLMACSDYNPNLCESQICLN